MEKIIVLLAQELSIRPGQAEAALKLLDEGNTIPFIARYRKELTGTLDEEQLRNLEARAQYLRNLDDRRKDILFSLREQGKLTPGLEQALINAGKIQELEDLYLPYRPKKRTRGQIAREKGLEPLAFQIFQQKNSFSLTEMARPFLSAEKGVEKTEDAWKGAQDIVAETISDRADIRERVRRFLWQNARLASGLTTNETAGKDFLMYKEYEEPIRQIPPHRTLALNRGEKLKFLKLAFRYPEEILYQQLFHLLHIAENTPFTQLYKGSCMDACKRLILPAIEREIRNELTEKAEKQAIRVFSENLRQLLLLQPIGGHTVIGLDPGYRTGCKTAVVDPQGKVLATDTLFLTGNRHQQEDAEYRFLRLVRQYHVTLISIGNGTASYETEEFTARMIEKHKLELSYLITSEAGASVYSASSLAREELPDLDVSLRGAVSIARRIQDPLAELVKIEPKAIGVGQYQHDVDQKELERALETVIESCVNHVGVDLNTASPALLHFVAGISSTVAKNIIAYREEHGQFTSRRELLKVPRLGPAAFTQCAGFLRIAGGQNPLDNTPVHPESYPLTEKILERLSCRKEICSAPEVQQAAAQADPQKIAAGLKAGLPTVTDILQALSRPGRDPREDSPAPLRRRHLTKLSDLPVGSIVRGVVRNVVDFGCFIDIGLKTDGLVHRSELSARKFRHPLDIVAPGDIVNAMVIQIDETRNRIGLSLKQVPAEK